jgi:outer membrane protein TolC
MNAKRWSLALIAAAAFASSGCVNQQQEVAHYQQILNSQPAPAPAQAPQRLTLAQAMRLANDENEQLAISGEDYLQALIARDRAFATFLPSVSLGAQEYQAKGFNTPPGFPDFTQIFQTRYFNVPLQTQLNVNVLQDATAISAADVFASQRSALLLDMQSTILLEVAQSYYQVLTDEHSVKVLSETLAVEQADVLSMQHKQQAGVALPLDVLQSQASAAQTQTELTDAENDVQTGRATLAFLMGVASLDGVELVDDFHSPAQVPELVQLDQFAQVHRQDTIAAAYAVVFAQKNVSAAFEEYAPTISINFNTFLFKQQFPTDQWWTGLFSINLPLFEGGMIYADIRTAYSKLRQAQLQQQYLAREVQEQVKIDRDNWLTSVQQVNNYYTEMSAAMAAWKQAQHSYSVGLAINLDVITAEDRALNAQLAYQKAIYAERTDMLDLVRETGGLNYAMLSQIDHTGTVSWTGSNGNAAPGNSY